MKASLTVYQPKGSMCMACQHLPRSCKHLAFHAMPVLSTAPGLVVVRCTDFAKRVDQAAPV